MKKESDDGIRIRLPSAKSVAVGVIIVALGFLVWQFIYEAILGSGAGPNGSGNGAQASTAGGLDTTIALLAAFGGVLLFIFGQFWSQLNALGQQFSNLSGHVDQKIKEQMDLQAESAVSKYERLTSRIENISDQYPWLDDFSELRIVSNVKTTSAVLSTLASLLEADQENFAYEWMVDSSKDSDLTGSAENYLALAIIASVLFRDDKLSLNFLHRIDEEKVPTWRNAIIVSKLRTGDYFGASLSAEAVERRYLENQIIKWLRERLTRKSSRYKATIPPETVGTLMHYYSIVGDRYGTENVVPRFRKLLGKDHFQKAKAIEEVLDSNSLLPISQLSLNVQVQSLLALLQVEAQLRRVSADNRYDMPHVNKLSRAIFTITGNRQLTKAFRVVGERLLQERLSRNKNSSRLVNRQGKNGINLVDEFHQSIDGDFVSGEGESFASEWILASATESEDIESDVVWAGLWRPKEQENAPDALNLGGRLPEKSVAEKLRKDIQERKDLAKSISGFRLKANIDRLRGFEGKKNNVVKELHRQASEGVDGDDNFRDLKSLRALDVVENDWAKNSDSELPSLLGGQLSELSLEFDDDFVVETAEVSWTNNYLLVRVRNDLKYNAVRFYYLFGLSGGIEGRIFFLDGSSNPIHSANKGLKFEFSDESAIAYLRFFCFFVRNNEFPFHVVEERNDFSWPPELTGEQEEEAASLLREATVIASDEDGARVISCTVYYQTSIFFCHFKIEVGGMIYLIEEEVLMTGLPPLLLFQISISKS